MRASLAMAGAKMTLEMAKDAAGTVAREGQRLEGEFAQLKDAKGEADREFKQMKAQLKARKEEAMKFAPTEQVVDGEKVRFCRCRWATVACRFARELRG